MALNNFNTKSLNSARRKNRDEIIDEISDFYNDDYKLVESILTSVSGKHIDQLSDDDEDEGFFVHFSTEELEEVLRRLAGSSDYTLSLDNEEKQILTEAMRDWSQPSFTKNNHESMIARRILRKLLSL